MKKIYLSLTFIWAIIMSQALVAQTPVKFEIKHFLSQAPFALNTVAQNNFQQDFTVTRLQYYISEIAITHDMGQVTPINDYWILVNADTQTVVDLGSYNIQQVEAISFYVGVDTANNHKDPALYPVSHPLGPKAPSMHWGWAAGYRFLAMEGNAGANMSLYQLHALGDKNYFQVEVQNPWILATANELKISLNADYTRALENIDVSSGVIVHGDYGAAQQALSNFQALVFSPATSNTSISGQLEAPVFSLYPNPATEGQVTIEIAEAHAAYEVVVNDLVGRQVYQAQMEAGQSELSLRVENAGMYLVTLIKDGKAVSTKKLVVK